MLVMCLLIFSTTMNSTTNVSAVEAKGVRVYWDSNCSNGVSSIEWGTLNPGSVKNVVVYIRNEEEAPMYLILSARNWTPPNTSEYLNLGCNYGVGKRMNPGETLQITLTLSVSRYIQGISRFSFDILVAGSDSLPGDVDGDGEVKGIDAALFGAAWGSVYGDPNYDPRCDFDGNGEVNGMDAAIFAANWWKTS